MKKCEIFWFFTLGVLNLSNDKTGFFLLVPVRRSHNNCPNEQIIAAGNVDKLQCDTMVSILFLYSSNMDGQRHQMVENAWTAFLLEYKFWDHFYKPNNPQKLCFKRFPLLKGFETKFYKLYILVPWGAVFPLARTPQQKSFMGYCFFWPLHTCPHLR